MSIKEIANMATTLMDKNGLSHIGFEFDNGKRRLGACWFRDGVVEKITLSKHYAAILPKEEIEEVILHEIAHALAGKDAGHGPEWKRIARSLGIKGDRCAVPSAVPDAPVKAYCPKCQKVPIEQHRLPTRVYFHARCSDISTPFVWFKNGKKVPLSAMPQKYQWEMQRLRNPVPSFSFSFH